MAIPKSSELYNDILSIFSDENEEYPTKECPPKLIFNFLPKNF